MRISDWSSDVCSSDLPFTDFTINLATGRVYASQWPAIGRNGYATVTYTAGYAPEEVPFALVQAMLLLIGHSFSNREAVSVGNNGSEIPLGVESLSIRQWPDMRRTEVRERVFA